MTVIPEFAPADIRGPRGDGNAHSIWPWVPALRAIALRPG
jgi:hypothetical protein